jgi:hypothetical protein
VFFGRGPIDSGKPYTVFAIANPAETLFEGKVLDDVPEGIRSAPLQVSRR